MPVACIVAWVIVGERNIAYWDYNRWEWIDTRESKAIAQSTV